MGALLEDVRRPAGGDSPDSPDTLAHLLRDLHVETMSAHRQQDVLRHWLDDHTPNRALRVSLRANGYGLLLNQLDGHRPSR